MVLKDSADETYFSEATHTNMNAKLVYEQMIKGMRMLQLQCLSKAMP